MIACTYTFCQDTVKSSLKHRLKLFITAINKWLCAASHKCFLAAHVLSYSFKSLIKYFNLSCTSSRRLFTLRVLRSHHFRNAVINIREPVTNSQKSCIKFIKSFSSQRIPLPNTEFHFCVTIRKTTFFLEASSYGSHFTICY